MGVAHADQGAEQVLGVDVCTNLARCRGALQQFRQGPGQQSAIAEARQACEDYATQNNLDPGKCVPVAVDERQVFDPGPLFIAAETAQDQQANLTTLLTPPRE